MESLRNCITHYALRITPITWRLAILLLPWQTRWFGSTPTIGGYAWEQGRLAFYLSWLPMLATIIFAVSTHTPSKSPPSQGGDFRNPLLAKEGAGEGKRAMAGLALLFFVSYFTFSPRATTEWWIEVAILSAFVWSLVRLHVDRQSFATWFVISLVPSAILGLVQFLSQTVVGSKWFGMAAQIPSTPGVSVVLHGATRVLRAYGGLPHPNIFGGWLVIGILIAITLKKSWATVIAALFSIVLVLTFSRGAWIALGAGLTIAVVGAHAMRPPMGVRRTPLHWSAAFVIFMFAITAFTQRSLLMGRVDVQGALENKSVSERIVGLQNGWTLFKQHPLVGVGPDATAFALQSQIIPHFVPLLLLDEIGLVGVIGFIFFFLPLTKGECHVRRDEGVRSVGRILVGLTMILVFCLFDHFPWSLWSGRALVAMVAAFVFLEHGNP